MDYVKQKDFRVFEVSGTTHGTANTSRLFRHAQSQVPWAVWIVEGNVYIPRNGLGPQEIDVRSVASSQAFRILLVLN